MAEIASLKTMLSSIQGSLITSVGLIQDQVDQIGKNYMEKVSSRLALQDQKLASIDENVKDLQQKSHIWDTFQHHVTSWAALMTSVDSKVDHISRAQAEQQSLVNGQLSTLQSSLTLGLEGVKEQITGLETRIRTLEITQEDIYEDVKNTNVKIEGLHSIRTRQRHYPHRNVTHHGGGVCSELKETVKLIYDKVNSNSGRTEGEDIDFDETYLGDDEVFAEKRHFLEFFRRMSLPFKKANRRLREMEDIRRKFQSNVDEMKSDMSSLTIDMDRRYNDFYNMTIELFQQQHSTLETYERQFASLRQCCTGTVSDLSGFEAKTMSVLRRIEDRLALPVSEDVTQRSREQLRFDTNRIVSILKEHEKILVDGFDRKHLPVPSTTTTTTAATTTVETEPLIASASSQEFNETFIMDDQEMLNVTRDQLKSCEELLKNGYIENDVYVVGGSDDVPAAASRQDFSVFERERLCDQTTSGGGWTVICPPFMLFVSMLLLVNIVL